MAAYLYKQTLSCMGKVSLTYFAGHVVFIVLFLSQSSNGIQDTEAITAEQHQRRTLCREWATNPTLIPMRPIAADHCPCVEQQMMLDASYKQLGHCYRQWFFRDGVKQMCCYDEFGTLITGSPNGGYLLLEFKNAGIEDAHYNCCHDNDEETCSLFYETNPSDDCSEYRSPNQATSWGDPVITTLDNHTYSFNGHGEYVYLDVNNGALQIQARTDYLVEGNNDATIFVAFVLWENQHNDRVTFLLNRTDSSTYVYLKNGSLWHKSTECNKIPLQTDAFRLFCDSTLNQIQIFFKQKLQNFANVKIGGGSFLSITTSAPPEHSPYPNTTGLASTITDGSYVFRNGTIIRTNSSEFDMFSYGESWALENETESVFNYELSNRTYSFYNGNHTLPRFLEDLVGNLTELFENCGNGSITEFNDTCRNSWTNSPNKECLLTIARTCNATMGTIIMEKVRGIHQQHEFYENKPPAFISSMPANITVYMNDVITLDLNEMVHDEDQPPKLKFFVKTDITNIYLAESGIFNWTVDEQLRYIDTKLTFVAKDHLNFTAVHEVVIYYCGCDNRSQCDFETSQNSSGSLIKAMCYCHNMYVSGDYCEDKQDPCIVNECFTNVTCDSESTDPNPCGPCASGFQSDMPGTQQDCINIHECETEDFTCDKGHCKDTIGSYTCWCDPTYTLNENQHACDDINECIQGTHNCKKNEICSNTDGSFVCECAPGYGRMDSSSKCTVIDGFSYVGEISVHVTSKGEGDVYSEQNKKNVQIQLSIIFQGPGFISVEIIDMSFSSSKENSRIRRASDSTPEETRLIVRYIVHWANESGGDITNILNERLLNVPFNTTIGTIIIMPSTIVFEINTEGGLCNITDRTDCDPDSTTCLDTNGTFTCQCRDGYKPVKLSQKYCIDVDECELMTNSAIIEDRCVHGKCTNSIGAWNCSCPETSLWQSVGNDTHPIYRCQGNYSYIGYTEFVWHDTDNYTEQDVISTIRKQLNDFFQDRSLDTVSSEVPLKDIFISANVYNLTRESISVNLQTYKAFYIIRLGDPVPLIRIRTLLSNVIKNHTLMHENRIILILQSYYIYNDSENMLCSAPGVNDCDEYSTTCATQNGTYKCICNPGFESSSHDTKFCRDVDECSLPNSYTPVCIHGQCSNTFGSWTCRCDDGFPVQNRNNNTITCSAGCNASEEHVCLGGIKTCVTNQWYCTCNPGYQPVNLSSTAFTCEDIDECNQNNTVCEKCINLPGSWTCNNCTDGYEAVVDGLNVTCTDIDECKDSSSLCYPGKCTNTVGNWSCSCPSGYTNITSADSLRRSCTDIDECDSSSTNTCKRGTCINTIATGHVVVTKGLITKHILTIQLLGVQTNAEQAMTLMFGRKQVLSGGQMDMHVSNWLQTSEVSTDVFFCKDIDECKLPTPNTCVRGKCVNTDGNWTCSCDDGFAVKEYTSPKVIQCTDECVEYKCLEVNKTTCVKDMSSCSCDNGYLPASLSSNVSICKDIDECSTETCGESGKCVNLPGSWTCINCPKGYTVIQKSDDVNCIDIDECSISPPNNCIHGTCQNTLGGWTCNCTEGYTLGTSLNETSIECNDIDECADLSYCNSGTCRNTAGNWYCDCPNGYSNETAKTSKSCTDIDECKHRDPGACLNAECENTIGSWICTCHPNETLWSVNENSKRCVQGGYQYAGSLKLSPVASATVNVHNSGLYDALQTMIMNTYTQAFNNITVFVEIVSVKETQNERVKRADAGVKSSIDVDYVVHLNESKSERELQTVETYFTSQHTTSIVDLDNISFRIAAFVHASEASLCNVTSRNNCDRDTTTCNAANGTVTCKCKDGFTSVLDSKTKCQDICRHAKCTDGSTCVTVPNEDRYVCICPEGKEGTYCDEEKTKDSGLSRLETILIGTGSGLGALLIFLAVVVLMLFKRKPTPKDTKQEQLSLHAMDTSFNNMNGSFVNTSYPQDKQPRLNGRMSNGSSYSNGVSGYPSYPVINLSPQQNGGPVGESPRSPKPDYGRPKSPKPDYIRQTKIRPATSPKPDYIRNGFEQFNDDSRDSGMGNGGSVNGDNRRPRSRETQSHDASSHRSYNYTQPYRKSYDL